MTHLQRQVALSAIGGAATFLAFYAYLGTTGLSLVCCSLLGLAVSWFMSDPAAFLAGLRHAWATTTDPAHLRAVWRRTTVIVAVVYLVASGTAIYGFFFWAAMALPPVDAALAVGAGFSEVATSAFVFAGLPGIIALGAMYGAQRLEKKMSYSTGFVFDVIGVAPGSAFLYFSIPALLIWMPMGVVHYSTYLLSAVVAIVRFAARFATAFYWFTVSDAHIAAVTGAALGMLTGLAIGKVTGFTPGFNTTATVIFLTGSLVAGFAGYMLAKVHETRAITINWRW